MRIKAVASLPLLLAALPLASAPVQAEEADQAAVAAVVEVLKERGLIDEADAQRIITLNRAHEKKQSWVDRITFFGDFRGRYEGFWWDDPDTKNQHRARYRLRFGAKAEINEYLGLAFRIASGSDSPTTRNQTLGSGVDFDPDPFNIDQAYLVVHPLANRELPYGQTLDLKLGKMGNMFRSDVGKDYVLWDADLTPEGVAFTHALKPADGLGLTLHGAYFIIDENSSDHDPALWALQLRAECESDALSGGINMSWYGFRSIDSGSSTLRSRGEASGNISGGGLSNDSSVDLGDLRVWGEFKGVPDWPILVYGNVLKNFSAEAIAAWNADEEDLAWGVGLEVGDKKKFAKVGAGYIRIEANATPGGVFTDSDLFQGWTNQEGWAVYGARQVFKNTDLSFTLFVGDDPLHEGITDPEALQDSDRLRLQTNLVVKF